MMDQTVFDELDWVMTGRELRELLSLVSEGTSVEAVIEMVAGGVDILKMRGLR